MQVAIHHMGNAANAEAIFNYDLPVSRIEIQADPKAVVDMGPSIGYRSLAFDGPYYIEVTIDDSSDAALASIKAFTLRILQLISAAPDRILFKSISAGYSTACGVKPDNNVVCWGSGQKPRVIGMYKSVSVGGSWNCGLEMDGDAVCFDNSGTIIVPTSTGIPTDGGAPIMNFQVPPPGPYASISTGYARGCGVKVDGTLACWGVWTTSDVPPQGTFASVSVGDSFACAVRTDSTVACWRQFNGPSIFAPLDGGAASGLPDGTVTSISAGVGFVCGVRLDSTLACWGSNNYGEATPLPGTFTAVAAGNQYACGIRTNGTLACWGENSYGRTMPPAGTFTALAAGYEFACAIRNDGTVACWGNNSMGQATPPTQ
jgi:hypothetical protein